MGANKPPLQGGNIRFSACPAIIVIQPKQITLNIYAIFHRYASIFAGHSNSTKNVAKAQKKSRNLIQILSVVIVDAKMKITKGRSLK
jgi:hypothetical protein